MPTHVRDHPSAYDSGRLDWNLFDPTVHIFARPVLLSALCIFHVSAFFFYPWILAIASAGGATSVSLGRPGTAPAPAGVGLPGFFSAAGARHH